MIALDTNIITALLKGEIKTLPDKEVYIPYAVLAEVKCGAMNGNNPKKYMAIVNEFLSGGSVTVSPGLDAKTVEYYVDIYVYLKKNGTPVSLNDLWIAAECMQLSLSLMTRDKDFGNIPQVLKV